jgi:hypothetical protein
MTRPVLETTAEAAAVDPAGTATEAIVPAAEKGRRVGALATRVIVAEGRRWVGALVTGVAVTVLAGCASSPPVPQWVDPLPAVSDAAAAPPSASVDERGLAASDERFVAAVRGRLSDATVDLRNEEITEMGGQACASLAAGQPRRAVVEELAGQGLPDAAARELVILARSTLCDSDSSGSEPGAGGQD